MHLRGTACYTELATMQSGHSPFPLVFVVVEAGWIFEILLIMCTADVASSRSPVFFAVFFLLLLSLVCLINPGRSLSVCRRRILLHTRTHSRTSRKELIT